VLIWRTTGSSQETSLGGSTLKGELLPQGGFEEEDGAKGSMGERGGRGVGEWGHQRNQSVLSLGPGVARFFLKRMRCGVREHASRDCLAGDNPSEEAAPSRDGSLRIIVTRRNPRKVSTL